MSAAYTPRLDDAVAFAMAEFRGVRRKGTSIPYITHLLQVLVTVGEHGGDEDQLCAAVLHDWLEDVPGADERVLAARFGPRVAALVAGLTDATTHPKPPWRPRKEQYLAKLRTSSPDLRLVSAADKLHNCQSIRRDFHAVGEDLWARFTAGREGTLWYYRAVTDALGDGWDHRLLHTLQAEVRGLETEAGWR